MMKAIDDESLKKSIRYPRSTWSFEDMVKLRTIYPDPTISSQDLKREFPRLSLQQIGDKAWHMGLRRGGGK